MKLLIAFAGYVIGVEDRRRVRKDRMKKNKCLVSRFADAVV